MLFGSGTGTDMRFGLGVLASPQGSVYHPGFGQVLQYEAEEISDDPDTQVEQVIGRMARLVLEDYQSPEIQRDLQAALTAMPGADPITAVYWWVKGRVDFALDEAVAEPVPVGGPGGDYVVEVLVRPRDLAALIAGGTANGAKPAVDCDDYSMYTAALLLAAGVEARFATVGADPDAPDRYSHVYVVAYPEGYGSGVRVAMDTSHGDAPGWEAPQRYRFREWDIRRTGLGVARWLALGAAFAFLPPEWKPIVPLGVILWLASKN